MSFQEVRSGLEEVLAELDRTLETKAPAALAGPSAPGSNTPSEDRSVPWWAALDEDSEWIEEHEQWPEESDDPTDPQDWK